MTPRVDELLSSDGSEHTGVIKILRWVMGNSTLAGTGNVVILPAYQGFEPGPARSFAEEPSGYDAHDQMASDAGGNACAAPLSFIEAGSGKFAGRIPTILNLDNSDELDSGEGPASAGTGSVDNALRLGCPAIGFTIYPGSAERNEMYHEPCGFTDVARSAGPAVAVRFYPRGTGVPKKGETAIDVVAYAGQIAAQLGAHIIKVEPRTDHITVDTGSGFGSIIGHNSSQMPEAEGTALLHRILEIYNRGHKT